MDSLWLLAGAGFMAGAMNALAGGGSFVSLPALIAAGVPPVLANTSSTVALYPGSMASAWAYRDNLSGVAEVPLRPLLIVTVLGGIAGALLLLTLPSRSFDAALPWLLLMATFALGFGRRIGEWVRTRCRLPRAVVQRCLHTLILLGIAEQHGRQYILTPRILGLGYAYFSSTPFVSLAQPVLEELSATVNETCALAIMEGHEMLYLARSEVNRLLATSMGLGSRLPAYCTSIGRVLLAQLSEPALARYFAATDLQPYTEFTLTTEARLRAELARIREQD